MQWGHSVIEKKKRKYLLSSEEWGEVENIVQVLNWPNILTQQLQAEQLTLSDVYGYWITMELKLRKESHPLAYLLLEHLAPRRVTVLENQAMNAAVYLDPRYNGLLNVEKRNEAVKFMQALWKRIRHSDIHNDDIGGQHHDIELKYECNDVDSDLMAFVTASDTRFAKSGTIATADENSLRTQLIEFYQRETILNFPKGENKNILGYWSSAIRFEYDALYELSQILLSVPATQVSVERAFSALRFVLNDYRTRLSDDSLEQILLLKLNW